MVLSMEKEHICTIIKTLILDGGSLVKKMEKELILIVRVI